MDGNATDSAGLEPANAGCATDHQRGDSGILDRARDQVAAARRALEGCNKQEAQEAKGILCYLAEILGPSPGEGERSGQGLGQTDEGPA